MNAPLPKVTDDVVDFGYDGQDIGCCNCTLGWNHGCCDDTCIACEEAPYCENARPCRLCNPLGDFQ